MSFVRALDRLLMAGCVPLAAAGLIFTFEQRYQTSSLLWCTAYVFATCRLLIAVKP